MSKDLQRLAKVKEALDDIEFILNGAEFKVTHAIEDRILKPAIRMNIIKIAEQFSKLKDENSFELLSHFDPNDLRGLSAVRNFIAHDYDSVDDILIEDVIRDNFPVLKQTVLSLLENEK
ncbi:MAG TPA: DUF86 domain-containing protein [Epsilonproteobacteria bacterium]|nr:DUF86 domain-containing protein [Campylobacterota bacterium]